MTLCKCGCMQEANKGRDFIRGHNSRGKNNHFYGKKHTKESIQKMSLGHVGLPSGNKGKKMSFKSKQKLSKRMIGKSGKETPHWGCHHSEKSKKKMSDAQKGKTLGEEHKKNIGLAGIGRKHSNKTKKQISVAKMGDKNPTWNGGSSFYPYCPKFTKKVKEDIRNKYGRKCILCDKSEEENGKKLSVHHVTYDKMDGCNGHDLKLVPLCISCHMKTNHSRDYYQEIILTKIVGFGIDPELK